MPQLSQARPAQSMSPLGSDILPIRGLPCHRHPRAAELCVPPHRPHLGALGKRSRCDRSASPRFSRRRSWFICRSQRRSTISHSHGCRAASRWVSVPAPLPRHLRRHRPVQTSGAKFQTTRGGGGGRCVASTDAGSWLAIKGKEESSQRWAGGMRRARGCRGRPLSLAWLWSRLCAVSALLVVARRKKPCPRPCPRPSFPLVWAPSERALSLRMLRQFALAPNFSKAPA